MLKYRVVCRVALVAVAWSDGYLVRFGCYGFATFQLQTFSLSLVLVLPSTVTQTPAVQLVCHSWVFASQLFAYFPCSG